jgi:predicted N-acetyltransferase YhbS
VQYHVRSARLTDVDAAVRILMRGASDPGEQRDDADHLRSLLFLPAATVLVAESGRQLVGVGVLSIRPSVRPGPFVGVIDELGLAQPADSSEGPTLVGGTIIEQLIASARNKGCARVEVTDPLASDEPALLESAGFEQRGALLSRTTG